MKKLSFRKSALPEFRSDKEVAEYFETHSVADVWNQLPAGKQAKPSAPWRSRFGSAIQAQNRHLAADFSRCDLLGNRRIEIGGFCA